MFDPFQVGAAVVGCLDVTVRLYTTLGTLATEAGNADSTTIGLCNKVKELKELLESVQDTYNTNQSHESDAVGQDEARIWERIKASLERCEDTLGSFEEEVTKIINQNGSGWARKLKFALNFQRFDPTMSRLESGIQIHIMAMQLKFWSLQV